MKGGKQGRAIRSQTFHQDVSAAQPGRREKGNSNSFFFNLLNIGSARKKDMQRASPEKSSGHEDTLLKRRASRTLNGSGFFIFKEEDLKSMTEMSPHNLIKKSTTTINTQQNFDFEALDCQLSQRQPPLIKDPPILDASERSLAYRLRSISHQQQSSSKPVNSAQKQRLLDFISESIDTSIVEEASQSCQGERIAVQTPKQGRVTTVEFKAALVGQESRRGV